MTKLRSAIILLALAVTLRAQPASCNTSNPSPSVTVALPSHPFAVVPSADGCWVFVSLMGGGRRHDGVAVLSRMGGHMRPVSIVPLDAQSATGMVLTHDGKLLIVASDDGVVFLDVQRTISGAKNALLGRISDGKGALSVNANVTADDKLLFVSNERKQSVTVIDLERARNNGYKADAVIGQIPTGIAPIGLAFSPDGKRLYITSGGAPPEWNWPKACTSERSKSDRIERPEGALVVVDVERASSDPAQSVVARVPAGCSPVRLALSPGGDRIYVTARNSNAVVVFGTAKLSEDPQHSRIGLVPTGPAPVPLAVVDEGKKVIAGNSNRFGGSDSPQTLTVIDAARANEGAPAVLGTIPAGVFPRDLKLSADGHTLFLANFESNSLQVIDVDHLPLTSSR